MVRLECERWAHKGINITYQTREDRKGYKAGALKQGMKHGYVRECEYVVIFDADFQPNPDYLHRTIPYLHHNPQIALVQARWRFGKFFLIYICVYHIMQIHQTKENTSKAVL
jgi:beta-mannan synthase